MPKIKVKVCGITNGMDAKRACDAGADFLGFNFYPRSPRYITPLKARRIVRHLPKGVLAVGVFVNEPEAKMLEIARLVGLHYLQLHGDESPATVSHLSHSLPVIKALRVSVSFRLSELGRFKQAAAVLLDGFDRRRRGGTGKIFDWALARRARGRGRIFLAGGLTPENVREAVQMGKPYAIDVCSGVEAKPGKKDSRKLRKLMRAIADRKGRKR
jgi:phosphoribosylanthranilate isomerase